MPIQQATLHTPESFARAMGDTLPVSESEVPLITKQILYPEGFQDQIFTSQCKNSETLHIYLQRFLNSTVTWLLENTCYIGSA